MHRTDLMRFRRRSALLRVPGQLKHQMKHDGKLKGPPTMMPELQLEGSDREQMFRLVHRHRSGWVVGAIIPHKSHEC